MKQIHGNFLVTLTYLIQAIVCLPRVWYVATEKELKIFKKEITREIVH